MPDRTQKFAHWTKFAVFLILAAGSGCDDHEVEEAKTCTTLFGAPTENTGLSDAQCTPACDCEALVWTAPTYTDDTVQALLSYSLLDEPDKLSANPYVTTPNLQPETDLFCAVVPDKKPLHYRLQTVESETEASTIGGHVTHSGACGQCSSLQNLAVYMGSPDLTDVVRNCGLVGMVSGEEANIACLMEIGFDLPCAQIWYYNTENTREVCLDPCLESLADPHQSSDGTLNACLQCDEDNSGPVFKAISGRTRRNSGLPSALCRPCDSIYPVVHDY